MHGRLPWYMCGFGTADNIGILQVGIAESSQLEAVCAAESICDTAESVCVTAVTEARAKAGVLGVTTTCTIRRDECPWVCLDIILRGNDCLRHDFLRESDLLRKSHSHGGRSGNGHCKQNAGEHLR